MWYDPRRWTSVLDEVRTLADRIDDPWLAVHARGLCAECSLELDGWRAQDARARERAAQAARARGERAILGLHLANHAHFQLPPSGHPGGCRTAEEGDENAIQTGETY